MDTADVIQHVAVEGRSISSAFLFSLGVSWLKQNRHLVQQIQTSMLMPGSSLYMYFSMYIGLAIKKASPRF
jgi:hypothetical protein